MKINRLKKEDICFNLFTSVVFSFVQTQNDLDTVDYDKTVLRF